MVPLERCSFALFLLLPQNHDKPFPGLPRPGVGICFLPPVSSEHEKVIGTWILAGHKMNE